ncbi:MAG: hypothetical protein BWK76_28125, partial [Desulfobulbaceae bacterium A2]
MPELKLKPYQSTAVEFLCSILAKTGHVALSAPIGSGKTVIIYEAVHRLLSMCAIGSALILAPRNVILSVYPDEARKWPRYHWLFPHVIHGQGRRVDNRALVSVINYDNIPWLAHEFGWGPRKIGQPLPWDLVVMDESHCVKDPTTQRFKLLRGMIHTAKYRVAMTGTILGNSLLDLWAQYYLLDRGELLLRSFDAFKMSFFTPIKVETAQGKESAFRKWVPRAGAMRHILNRVAPVTHTIPESEVGRPEIDREILWVDLPERAKEIMGEMERECFLTLDGKSIEAWNAITLVAKLRQIAAGFAYHAPVPGAKTMLTGAKAGWTVIHREKMDMAKKVVEGTTEAIMIVANFDAEFEQLKDMFPGLVIIKGNMTPSVVRRNIDLWNSCEVRLLAVHPKSAGTGLNLQHGGSRQLWIGPDWSFLSRDQTEGRIRRLGQGKSVTV